MSQPTDQQCGRSVPRLVWLLRPASVWLGGYLLLSTARCTFPEYNVPPRGVAAGAGVGASTSTGATGATLATGGTDGSAGADSTGGSDSAPGGSAGVGGDPTSGGAPECAPEQWPVDACPSTCLRRFPDHCYDGKKSGDEIASDCGGGCQRCTNEACGVNEDCLSGKCEAAGDESGFCFAPISIKLTSQELSPLVGSIAWTIDLLLDPAAGAKGYGLKDLKVRYYFDRSGLVEPLLVRATQSNLKLQNGQSRSLPSTSWSVQRTEHRPSSAYDAYLEVGFGETGQLFAGDQIELFQQMSTGDSGRSSFDQRANYSYSEVPDVPTLHINVFYQDKLVWGLEPQPANPRACFVRGVNLNGPAVVVDSNPWQGAAQAAVTTSGSGVSQATTPFPAASGGLATALNTATRLPADHELTLPVDNGVYLLYLYATSPGNDAEASLLTVQGVAPDRSQAFRAQTTQSGQVWARLGPYRVDVTTGKLSVGVTKGAINFAGLELWYPE